MDASLFYMDLLELSIIMHRSRWQTGVTGHMSNGAHIWHLFVKCQKIKHLDHGGGSQKKKINWHNEVHRYWRQFWHHIWWSLKTLKMSIEIIFGQFCWPSYLTSKLTSISVNLIMSIYFFLWTSSIVCMFGFLIFDIFLTTWHLFDILTHQLNLSHLSPHRAIFFKNGEIRRKRILRPQIKWFWVIWWSFPKLSCLTCLCGSITLCSFLTLILVRFWCNTTHFEAYDLLYKNMKEFCH